MTTYNDSYRNQSSSMYRWTLSFKVSMDQHTQVQEIVSKTGQDISIICRNLIDLGLANYNNRYVADEDKPLMQLFEEAKRVRKLRHIIQVLAEVKDEISPEDYERYCHSLGIDPKEVEDAAIPRGKVTKRDRCCSFLRVLFTDRPQGLPANRVLEIAAREGFGKNLVYEAATCLGIRFQVTETNQGRMSLWIPPETF
jgi:hypothetical protein